MKRRDVLARARQAARALNNPMLGVNAHTRQTIVDGNKVTAYAINGESYIESKFSTLSIEDILTIRNGGENSHASIMMSIVHDEVETFKI
jgi:hypothetical protein